MVLIERITGLFGQNAELLKDVETFRHGEWQFRLSPWTVPSATLLGQALNNISGADSIRLTASIDGGGPISLSSRAEAEVSEYIRELATYHGIEEGRNSLEITLTIGKTIENSCLSLYSLSTFERELQRLNAKQSFAMFEPVCSSDETHCVQLHENSEQFATDFLTFSREACSPTKVILRNALAGARNDACHFEVHSLRIVPEDFHLEARSHFQGLNEVFDRLCLIATLGYLCDVSTVLETGRFVFKLNGYRAITGEIQTQNISTGLLDELYKVYHWAYSGGSLPDKLGLARNIISLHWKGDVTNAPDAGIYESVLSAHAIYLKENVDRYISLKKSLCDYLGELSQKSAKLAESIGDKLENNFMAFVGFFISTILLKAVTEKNLEGLFPKPLQLIAWGLITASFVHGVVSLCFSMRERTRFIQDFNLLRKRYDDLLHKSDLDRVLGQDSGYRETIAHLDFKLWLFFAGWLVMLLVCAGVVIGLRQTMLPSQGPFPSTNNLPPSSLLK